MRARDLGVVFDGTPGPLNAITDVAGVEVGHCTLIEGDSVRTGVTAVHARGKEEAEPCFAGWFSLNGNGEMTGTAWIDESGLLTGSVLITNTHSVGVVRDATIAWEKKRGRNKLWSLPVVAETYDGVLNDINAFSIKLEHAFEALDSARGGPVPEGNVGGGTGMICYGWKGGIGTSSRVVNDQVVGVLVQANHGQRNQLRLPSGPVGHLLEPSGHADAGSIIIIVATDAPLLPHQCRALSKRAALGLGRTGAIAAVSSGDIFLAFSTGNRLPQIESPFSVETVGMTGLTPLFEAVVQATEEAIWNALAAAETMTGYQGATVEAIPQGRIRAICATG